MAILYQKKVDFRTNKITRDQEKHYLMIKKGQSNKKTAIGTNLSRAKNQLINLDLKLSLTPY